MRGGVVIAAVLAALVVVPVAEAASARVAAVQVALRERGLYPGPVDGIAGPLTRTAVVRFQSRRGLLQDGRVGPRTRQALGVQMMMAAAEWAPQALLSLGARAASGPINMIVTNVPGPQFPLYQLGARLLELYPLVPLLENTGLGVALFSYDGRLCWGFNADYDRVPDLDVYVAGVDRSFLELAEALGVRSSGAIEVIREPSSHEASGESVEPAAESGRRRNGARSTRRAAPAAAN